MKKYKIKDDNAPLRKVDRKLCSINYMKYTVSSSKLVGGEGGLKERKIVNDYYDSVSINTRIA